MHSVRVDILISSKDPRQICNLKYITAHKVKKLGFNSSAELLTEAYSHYDPALPYEVLMVHSSYALCSYFVRAYKLTYKEDILYLLRHPEIIPMMVPEEETRETKRAVVKFSKIDRDEREKSVCDFLLSLKPRERTIAVSNIIEQYLLLNANDFFLKEESNRLMKHLMDISEFDQNGKVQGQAARLIDAIWEIGAEK